MRMRVFANITTGWPASGRVFGRRVFGQNVHGEARGYLTEQQQVPQVVPYASSDRPHLCVGIL